ncbi:MAG: DNA polymerase III subunit beta [Bacteroidales bacterium]|jgi:DNA polymerase-3 subunit beta
MNFIVSSTLLLKNLQALSGVIGSNNTLPILDSFLFEISSNELVVSATDLETTMIAKINVQSKDSGSIAIPSKILLETLKAFPPDTPITFLIDNENYSIDISAIEGKYKLTGQNGKEFPKIPKVTGTTKFEIDADALYAAISKTLFATGTDDLRPVMTGVYCQFNKDDITFVATDAHKLVRYRRSDIKSEVAKTFVLPKKPLNQLKNTLGNLEKSKVKIESNDSNAFFSYENINLICRLIDGNYPNYEVVIPSDNPNKLNVDREVFLNSIKRVSIYSSQSTHQIRFKISGNEIRINADDPDYGNSAVERLTCKYKGEDLEIGFNSRFLIEMLSNIDTQTVNLEMSTPNRAGLIIPVDPENKSEDVLMLVMPVMLNY